MILGFDLSELIDMLRTTIVGVGSLTGLALVITMVVNVLKFKGIVKDGTSQNWVAALNVVSIAVLYVLKVLKFNVDFSQLNDAITVIYQASVMLISFFWANFASKFGYSAVKNVAVIGKSYNTEV